MDAKRRSAPATVDPRDQPTYNLTEAARYLRLAPGTLRSWVVGRRYPAAGGTRTFAPLIRPAQKVPLALSFWDLVEAHVLRALRTDHEVAVKALRPALRYAESKLGIDKLLLRPDLLTGAGHVLLDRYGALIDLSASGQLALRKVFEAHLRRVEWDADRLPFRLFPFSALDAAESDRSIAIDPRVAFGRPIVERAGISTAAIARRLDAGETVSELADDYDLTAEEIEQAAVYERAA